MGCKSRFSNVNGPSGHEQEPDRRDQEADEDRDARADSLSDDSPGHCRRTDCDGQTQKLEPAFYRCHSKYGCRHQGHGDHADYQHRSHEKVGYVCEIERHEVKQWSGEQGVGGPGVHQDQQHYQHRRDGKRNRHQGVGFADPDESHGQQRECRGEHDSRRDIDPDVAVPPAGRVTHDPQRRDGRNRDVEPERPLPRQPGRDSAAPERTEHAPGLGTCADEPVCDRTVPAVDQLVDRSYRDRDDGTAADRLEHPHADQPVELWRSAEKPAGDLRGHCDERGAECEHTQRRQECKAVASAVGDTSHQRHCRGETDQEPGDRPRCAVQLAHPDAQIGHHVGQQRYDHRHVVGCDKHAEAERQEQPVGGYDSTGSAEHRLDRLLQRNRLVELGKRNHACRVLVVIRLGHPEDDDLVQQVCFRVE